MQPPCEVMVTQFLPAMRGIVSHELSERGESQRRIAVMLGITQARVSYYLSVKKSNFVNDLSSKFGVPAADVQGYAKVLSEDVSRSQVDGIFTLYSIWKTLLFSGSVCSIHQRQSRISTECSVCMELHKPVRDSSSTIPQESEDNAILKDIADATAMLETSASFPALIPEVAVNIASSRSHPKSVRDVAAVPGRINKIHGRAKAFVPPEFGCSNHSSRVLLILNNRHPNLRAVMNVKFDPLVQKSLEEVGMPFVFTSSNQEQWKGRHHHSSDEDAGFSDAALLRISRVSLSPSVVERAPFAIIDRGSEGVEPITYIFGERAVEIAQVALKLSHAHSNLVLER